MMKALLIVDVQASYFGRYDASLLARINRPILEAQEQKQDLNEVFDMLEVQHRTLLDLFMREAYIQTMDS